MRYRRSFAVAVTGVALGLVVVQVASTSGAGAQPGTGSQTTPPLGSMAPPSSHDMGAAAPMAASNAVTITAPPEDQVRGVTPSTAVPDTSPTHHEFQANCSVTHRRADDPIVFPNKLGASHDHTFLGNPSVNAASTVTSLRAATTTCKVPEDRSAYWMPTMFDGDKPVLPVGPQVIYYKAGVFDYTSVRPFPTGLRYVVGSPSATMDQFRNSPGAVEGFECGNSSRNYDFTTLTSCPTGSQVNVRYQAPSCWDGVHLYEPDGSHIVYPVDGQYGRKVCPASNPVAVPMLEFKMAFPVDGNVSRVRLASGRGYSFHYDFFNAWDPATLTALVRHCINGGLQCNTRGFDLYKPARGAALTEDHRLP